MSTRALASLSLVILLVSASGCCKRGRVNPLIATEPITTLMATVDDFVAVKAFELQQTATDFNEQPATDSISIS
jgi:hypothetical protein